ncbi:MAG TPA: outer membrane beta-barrel protein [Puia sp.]
MKESNFYSDEFEQLLREKTEQYKMYPSEKVWKGIHGSLHTKRKWFISGMSLLIIGILYFAGRDLLLPSKAELAKRSIASTASPADITNAGDENTAPLIAAAGQRHSTSSTIAAHRNAQYSDDKSYKEINIGLTDPAVRQRDISEMLSQVVALPAEPPSIPLIVDLRMPSSPAVSAEENLLAQTSKPVPGAALSTAPANDRSSILSLPSPAPSTSVDNAKDDAPVRIARNTAARNTLAATRHAAGPVAGGGSVDNSRKSKGGTVAFTDEIADQQRINWLYDYAVYNLPAAAKRNRKYFQLYSAPTATYRSLSGGTLPAKSDPNMRGPKNYLDHSAVWGFEVGGSFMYRITRNLTLKAGLQFNYSRYTVRGYADMRQSSPEIRTAYGHALDSVNTPPMLWNSYLQKSQINLTNDIYQLSAPIGFELRVMGNERLQLNVGASIQPSYLLNTNVYFLTSEYTDYVKGPSQFRRWNLTGGLEAFLSYKLPNGLRLQAGPEFRYQLLSSFYNSYPIKENLKGYGLKIGIVKAIP